LAVWGFYQEDINSTLRLSSGVDRDRPNHIAL
jgi:hypothetical protein